MPQKYPGQSLCAIGVDMFQVKYNASLAPFLAWGLDSGDAFELIIQSPYISGISGNSRMDKVSLVAKKDSLRFNLGFNMTLGYNHRNNQEFWRTLKVISDTLWSSKAEMVKLLHICGTLPLISSYDSNILSLPLDSKYPGFSFYRHSMEIFGSSDCDFQISPITDTRLSIGVRSKGLYVLDNPIESYCKGVPSHILDIVDDRLSVLQLAGNDV